jgi:anti-sigma B factor antagonist
MITLPEPTLVGAHTVIEVTGEVDMSTSGPLRDSLLALINRGVTSLVVDLRPVTFIDSTGVGTLLRIFQRQTLQGGAVHFVADQPAVLRVLDLMQLTRRLHVTASVAEIDRCCAQLPAGKVIPLRRLAQ